MDAPSALVAFRSRQPFWDLRDTGQLSILKARHAQGQNKVSFPSFADFHIQLENSTDVRMKMKTLEFVAVALACGTVAHLDYP